MNNFGFFFTPLFPYWLIALIIPLFTFFIWREIKRNQRFQGSRILAQIIVLTSVLGILLRPGFLAERKSSSIMLLTPGYSEVLADSLLSAYPDLRVVRLKEVEFDHESDVLPSYYDLAAWSSQIAFILGDGLPTHALDLMTDKKFNYLPSSQPSGITQLQLPKKATANQIAHIKGLITTDGKTRLALLGAGGREDSVNITGENIPFELSFLPKQPGLFVYNLQYNDRSGLHTEQIPVEVFEEQKLNILFLQKSPGFELRQLKNFLAERGHKLSLRYQLSKNNYRVEFANTAPTRITPLASSILQSFDLVILNNEVLESLNASERSVLEKSIHEGLGLILILNRPTEHDKLREQFFPVDLKKVLKDTAQLSLSHKQYTLPVIPLQIGESDIVYTSLKNKTRVLSAFVYLGTGKVGVQFLQETYRIALEGNSTDYASIWSPLLEKTARMKREKFKIQLTNSLPSYPDEPLFVEVISAVEEHPLLQDNTVRLPLLEHPTIDNFWSANTWAGTPGWHRLTAADATLNYFISEATDLNSLRIAQQQLENKKASINVSPISTEHLTYHPKTVPIFIYFLLFIFASGYLWLAPKL